MRAGEKGGERKPAASLPLGRPSWRGAPLACARDRRSCDSLLPAPPSQTAPPHQSLQPWNQRHSPCRCPCPLAHPLILAKPEATRNRVKRGGPGGRPLSPRTPTPLNAALAAGGGAPARPRANGKPADSGVARRRRRKRTQREDPDNAHSRQPPHQPPRPLHAGAVAGRVAPRMCGRLERGRAQYPARARRAPALRDSVATAAAVFVGVGGGAGLADAGGQRRRRPVAVAHGV